MELLDGISNMFVSSHGGDDVPDYGLDSALEFTPRKKSKLFCSNLLQDGWAVIQQVICNPHAPRSNVFKEELRRYKEKVYKDEIEEQRRQTLIKY